MLAKIVSLQEMDDHWTLCDLAECHEAMDIQQEAEEYEMNQAEIKAKRNKRR